MNTVAKGPCATIYYACDAQGRFPAKEFLDDLAGGDPARKRDHASLLHLFQMFCDAGRITNKQHFKVIEGTNPKLVEFKKYQARIFGYFDGAGRLVLTHGCIKKKDKLDPTEVERAYRIRVEYSKSPVRSTHDYRP